MSKTFYVKVSEEKITKTIPLGYGTYVDLDKAGEPVGIEIILKKVKKK